MANGTTFIYTNQFGGNWVSTPFDDSAQAQSYTPPLNQPWDYSTNKYVPYASASCIRLIQVCRRIYGVK